MRLVRLARRVVAGGRTGGNQDMDLFIISAPSIMSTGGRRRKDPFRRGMCVRACVCVRPGVYNTEPQSLPGSIGYKHTSLTAENGDQVVRSRD